MNREDMKEVKEIFLGMFEILDDAKFAEVFASFYHRLFLQLIEKGFSREEAIHLISRIQFIDRST